MGLWRRIKQLPVTIKGALEGSWRGPFSGIGELGHVIGLGSLEDGWQRNISVSARQAERFGPVYTCISILAQELSRIPIVHQRHLPDGRHEAVTNKAPHRVFRKPNIYQTKSDFILYLMRSLLLDGNAYAIAKRNDRFEVESLYPIHPDYIWPYIVDGEIFYRFTDSAVADLMDDDKSTWFAQRDVLHIRLFTPVHPLVGESPITAALHPAAAGMEINSHTTNFFHNMSRPSGILRHPGALSEPAMQRIKQKFMEITQRAHTGEPIVLQENMDWKQLTMSAVDAELINSYKLTERQVAQVFRVPPFLLGDLEKATFQNVESLARFFVQSALGFYIDHFEDAFTAFFNLPNNEEIWLDVETALLRTDMKERMDAYAKAIQNGVYAPDEARAKEGLPPVEYGDMPRVQQQLVPLSYGVMMTPKGMEQPPVEPVPPEPEPTEEQMIAARLVAEKAIKKAMAA
jgi:HK97 family phage portal protein